MLTDWFFYLPSFFLKCQKSPFLVQHKTDQIVQLFNSKVQQSDLIEYGKRLKPNSPAKEFPPHQDNIDLVESVQQHQIYHQPVIIEQGPQSVQVKSDANIDHVIQESVQIRENPTIQQAVKTVGLINEPQVVVDVKDETHVTQDKELVQHQQNIVTQHHDHVDVTGGQVNEYLHIDEHNHVNNVNNDHVHEYDHIGKVVELIATNDLESEIIRNRSRSKYR